MRDHLERVFDLMLLNKSLLAGQASSGTSGSCSVIPWIYAVYVFLLIYVTQA
jgi:hypothetical protein